VNVKLRLTVMHDSHGSTRAQAVAPVLSMLESTHLLIRRVLALTTGSGRRALEVLCGRIVTVAEPGGRGESVLQSFSFLFFVRDFHAAIFVSPLMSTAEAVSNICTTILQLLVFCA